MSKKISLGKKLGRIVILLVALGAGVGSIAFFVSRLEPPARVAAAENLRAVQVMQVEPVSFSVQASGFGSAVPEQTWSAISNVKGRVVFRHENLESGEILEQGSLLLQTDPIVYELGIREAEAEIASVVAEIEQLKQEVVNADSLLDLEQQRLALSETALERTRSLMASGSVPQSSLDTQLRATLAQRQAVQGLINQQTIIPIQLNRLDAQKERVLAKLEQVQSDLEDTNIYAPFDMRISEVNVEEFQYVNPGQVLFSGDDIAASEIVLQVPMQDLRRVLNEIGDELGSSEELNISGIEAGVKLVGDDQSWDAQVVRIANGIDVATRTVQVVLRVEQPGSSSDLNSNPPLPKGMFVEGVLQAQMKYPQLVVPQGAIHQGWVYLVDEQSRLERREVTVLFQQNGMAVIAEGLEGGEYVILDDLVPAISGMLLEARTLDGKTINAAGEAQ
ncbi:MAG: efflux RND transporter periplasmic adaptor subunit [Devosiaceae bacterium]|nr:efflux RND transporter periplasmic adaptor subunit [Devosiaceae bacterium]